MQSPTLTRQPARLRLSALAHASLLLFPAVTLAQPNQFRFGGLPQTDLTAPQIDEVSGPTIARLNQAAALVQEKNWIEAIDIYRELSHDDTHRVVATENGPYLSLRKYCQLQLTQMPSEGLAAYRRNVDPLAERWYREAIADRDEPKLRRLLDEMLCSSWGDDALLVLGEMALERADFAAARRWWEQISPLLRDPRGLPLWISLRDIDVDANWPEIERRWNNRTEPAAWLAYPDTTLDLAEVRARLILASIRADDLDRAALELDVFRRLHPTAAGRLGGKEGPYVPAIERLLSTARELRQKPTNLDWPTFAGSQTRSGDAPPIGPILGAAWAAPVPLPEALKAPLIRPDLELEANVGAGVVRNGAREVIAAEPESDLSISCFPIVVDNIVAFHDGRQIRAVNLATGKPAVTKDGTLYREGSIENPALQGRTDATNRMRSFAAHGVARCTLNAVDGVIYSRVGQFPTVFRGSGTNINGDRLIGVDVSRDGLLAFQIKPPDPSYSFDGTPVSDGRRVWVALRRRDVLPHAYVACFDFASGAELWRTSIGAADTPAAGMGHEITHNLLTFVGDQIYFNTNLGLVAALDADTGDIDWLHRYERSSGGFAERLEYPLYFDRHTAPCMVRDGLVIVAPADSPAVFALDAKTGKKIWSNDQLPDVLYLLGVAKQNLIVSGNRLHALDIRSGVQRFAWPDSEHAGIRGIGRGLVAGDEIFWPARDAIYVLNALTGERTRAPIEPPGINYRGANLAATRDHMIVATHDKLIALGSQSATNN